MSTRLIRKQTGLTHEPELLPPDRYHQTHYTVGLAACCMCGQNNMWVHSFGRYATNRKYYVRHLEGNAVDCPGTVIGPERDSVRGAAEAFNTAMKLFSASFQEGRGGEY